MNDDKINKIMEKVEHMDSIKEELLKELNELKKEKTKQDKVDLTPYMEYIRMMMPIDISASDMPNEDLVALLPSLNLNFLNYLEEQDLEYLVGYMNNQANIIYNTKRDELEKLGVDLKGDSIFNFFAELNTFFNSIAETDGKISTREQLVKFEYFSRNYPMFYEKFARWRLGIVELYNAEVASGKVFLRYFVKTSQKIPKINSPPAKPSNIPEEPKEKEELVKHTSHQDEEIKAEESSEEPEEDADEEIVI